MDRVNFRREQEERARIEKENLEKEYEKQLCIKMARLRKEQRERDIKEQEEYIKSFEHQEYIRQIRKKQDKYLEKEYLEYIRQIRKEHLEKEHLEKERLEKECLEKEHLELVDRVEKERIEFKKKYIDIFNPSDKNLEPQYIKANSIHLSDVEIDIIQQDLIKKLTLPISSAVIIDNLKLHKIIFYKMLTVSKTETYIRQKNGGYSFGDTTPPQQHNFNEITTIFINIYGDIYYTVMNDSLIVPIQYLAGTSDGYSITGPQKVKPDVLTTALYITPFSDRSIESKDFIPPFNELISLIERTYKFPNSGNIWTSHLNKLKQDKLESDKSKEINPSDKEWFDKREQKRKEYKECKEKWKQKQYLEKNEKERIKIFEQKRYAQIQLYIQKNRTFKEH